MTAAKITLVALAVTGVLAPRTIAAQDVGVGADPPSESPQDEGAAGPLDRYRDLYMSLRNQGIVLGLGSILPGSSLAASIEVKRDRLLGTPVGSSVEASWSVRGYQQYDFRLGLIKGRTHRTELASIDTDLASVFNDNSLLAFGTSVFLDIRQRVYPRVDFFGLGQSSRLDGRSDFRVVGPSVDLVYQWQRGRHFGLSARTGTLELRVSGGTNHGVPDIDARYSPVEAPGVDVQRRYRTTGAAVTWDFRNRPHFTSKGTFLSLGLWHVQDLSNASSRENWDRLIAEVRQFQALHGTRHVLAMRGLLSTRLGGGSTPFYLQPTLGGSKTLRGFGSYRLRGDAVWSGTAEYRWRAHKWIEVASFVDVGSVADSWKHLAATDAAVTPGFGVRVTSENQVIGRLDVARSRDGVRVVMTVSAPF